MNMNSFDPSNVFSDNYKILIGSILPRPIAWISTLNRDGTFNLAPFSFFTAVSADPMIIAFCPMIRSSTGELKDTTINILERKEFVVNFVHEELAQEVNLTSTELAYGEDEFKFAGIETIDSLKVKAPRVKKSLIHFECLYRDHLDYGKHVGAGMIITGEVVKIHIDPSIIHDGKISTDLLNPIGRGAGIDWIKCDHRFQLDRLTKAQIHK